MIRIDAEKLSDGGIDLSIEMLSLSPSGESLPIGPSDFKDPSGANDGAYVLTDEAGAGMGAHILLRPERTAKGILTANFVKALKSSMKPEDFRELAQVLRAISQTAEEILRPDCNEFAPKLVELNRLALDHGDRSKQVKEYILSEIEKDPSFKDAALALLLFREAAK